MSASNIIDTKNTFFGALIHLKSKETLLMLKKMKLKTPNTPNIAPDNQLMLDSFSQVQVISLDKPVGPTKTSVNLTDDDTLVC